MPRPDRRARPPATLAATAVRTGKHGGYDRVVFQFSGGLPAVTAERIATVYADPRGTPVSLARKSRLHVVGLGARGGYHISSLAGPDRVVIDFTHPRAS